ncbi:MAG: GAF domain-containing protein [Spirochaetales bacterium]|nr:GAF domain-containing protein [Leptospiraceae bacterium]MCP5480241.1 GAF domain-containing protein [Spirochaetales bacterium]MCP5486360.1 GAF domain-containing protein [Spirochaetales bacterium]
MAVKTRHNEILTQRLSYTVRLGGAASFVALTFFTGYALLSLLGLFALSLSLAWAIVVERRNQLSSAAASRSSSYFRTSIDLLGLTLFVHLTGNVHSFLIMVYVVVTALSSIKEKRQIGLFAAFGGALCLGLLSALVGLGLVPDINLLTPRYEYSRAYGVAAPVFLLGASLLVHFVIYGLYNGMTAALAAAETETEQSVMAMVLAEKARFEVEAYNEFSRKLNSTESIDEVIDQIFAYIQENFNIEGNILYLYDEKQDKLYHYKSNFPDSFAEEDVQTVREIRIPMHGEEGGIHSAVFQKRRYVYFLRIRDSLTHFEKTITDRMQIKSILIVPLVVRDRVFGMIDFSNYNRPLRLTRSDIDSIRAFCEQIAGAVQSSLLIHEAREAQRHAEEARREIEESREEIRRLNQFSRTINATSQLDVILDKIFSYIREHYGIEGIWLQFIDSDNNELYTYKNTKDLLSRDQLDYIRNLRVPLGPEGGIAYDVYARKRPFYLAKRPRSFKYAVDQTHVDVLNIESALYVPLLIGDRVVAVISFTRYHEKLRLSRKEIDSITGFCQQIAGAINNSHLHAESELSRMMAEQSLAEVQQLKAQQDLDYYLTSNLVEPLTGIHVNSETVEVVEITRQKKRFPYMRWTCEIGGDLCLGYSLRLGDRPYTAVLNADAMGKSLQGAGGILVLGSVFRNIVDRTPESRYQYPEQWLKNAYRDLDNIFRAFDGSMYITSFVALIDDNTGLVYYINAEHPPPVLLRDGKAEFLKPPHKIQKLGFLLGQLRVSVALFRMEPGDFLITGSDGREDIMIRAGGERTPGMNTDEDLFLRVVEEARGELDEVHRLLQNTGTLTDDLSLLRIGYHNTTPGAPVHLDLAIVRNLLEETRKHLSAKRLAKAEKTILPVAEDVVNSGYSEVGELNEALGELMRLAMQVLRRRKKPGQARELAVRYSHLHPEATFILEEAARACQEDNDPQAATDFSERVYIREPGNQENLIFLLRLHIVLRNRSRVDHLFRRLRESNLPPDQVEELEREVRDAFEQAYRPAAP